MLPRCGPGSDPEARPPGIFPVLVSRAASGDRRQLDLPPALPHPNRYSTKVVASTKMLPKTREAPRWSRRIAPAERALCGRWPSPTTDAGFPRPDGSVPPERRLSGCQRSTNHCGICVQSTAESVQSKGLGSEGALGVSDQHPAHVHRRLARAVPERRLRPEFHHAGGAVVPSRRHLDT